MGVMHVNKLNIRKNFAELLLVICKWVQELLQPPLPANWTNTGMFKHFSIALNLFSYSRVYCASASFVFILQLSLILKVINEPITVGCLSRKCASYCSD